MSNSSTKSDLHCPSCDGTFSSERGMSRHINTIHSNTIGSNKQNSKIKGRFLCTFRHCHTTFSFENNLRRHLLNMHYKTNKKAFQCKFCSKKFNSQRYVSRHIKDFHLREKKYVCAICHKIFPLRNSIVGHLKYAHGEIWSKKVTFTCDKCRRSFNRKTNLQTHIMFSCGSSSIIERPTITCPKCHVHIFLKNFKGHQKHCPRKRGYRNNCGKNLKSSEILVNKKIKTNRNQISTSETKPFDMSEQGLQESVTDIRRSNRKRTTVDYHSLDNYDIYETNDSYIICSAETQNLNFEFTNSKLKIENENLHDEFDIGVCSIEKEEHLLEDSEDPSEEINKVFKPSQPIQFKSSNLSADLLLNEEVDIKEEIKEDINYEESCEADMEKPSTDFYKLIRLM